MLYPEIVIVGCGNPLFADDGFGPAVVEEMKKLSLPDNVKVEDAGLGAPHFIFTLLDPENTKKLIIVDTADFGAEPGTIRRLKVEDLPPEHTAMHIHGISLNRWSGSKTRSISRLSDASQQRLPLRRWISGFPMKLRKQFRIQSGKYWI